MATAEAATTGVSFHDSQSDTSTRHRSTNGDSRGSNSRRRSSLMLDPSYNDASTHGSTVGDTIENEVEVSLWYSVPLLLAIVPAVAGLAFNRGSIIITDLALLVLAAIYLHWCLLTPWTWYHAAQAITVAKAASASTMPEGAIETEEGDDSQEEGIHKENSSTPTLDTADKMAANAELRVHELLALLMCFLGPLVGAYILHIVREQIAIGHDMVTNLHLSLFVLGAEIRPMRYCMKIIHARTLHLQRRVREDPYVVQKVSSDSAEELAQRIDALDASVADLGAAKSQPQSKASSESAESMKKLQSGLQTQVDALNRAVRRYEKRATAQTMQTEARLLDLEYRLKDALSLAAAAAACSQKPGGGVVLMESFGWVMTLPLKFAQFAFLYPLELAAIIVNRSMIRMGFATPPLPKRAPSRQPLYRVRV